MKEWNTHYRAFLDFKKKTSEEKNIKKTCEAIERASTDDDSLESVRTYCIIEEDWIQIIEAGMEHVEKAVREERQFIRKQGEVVPIEKLRRVSTETVKHLAKHSELITEEPEEGETLTPEKLYMAENLSDYAVYENRFLYMLLCYVRDFINARLDKIIEFGRTYRMKAKLEKRVRMGKKSVTYVSTMAYEDKNDPLSESYSASLDLIERIQTLQRLTTSLLMTPLMKEVSKAPMLKPPITRTNVLRMNVHFKAAMEMYGKLCAYTKPGYVIEEIKNTLRPFSDALLAEEAQVMALQEFLYYKYGNKLSEQLRAEYKQEEEERRKKEALALKERAARLKQKLKEGGGSIEEYVETLEAQIYKQEKNEADLLLAKKKIESLNEKIAELNGEVAAWSDRNDLLKATIAEKDRLRDEREKEFSAEQAALKEECETALLEKEKAIEEERESFGKQLLKNQEESDAKYAQLEEEKQRIEQEMLVVKAQVKGIRYKYSLIGEDEDFSDRAAFLELEKEYAAFEAFFKEQWGFTKKRIRMDVFSVAPDPEDTWEKNAWGSIKRTGYKLKKFFAKVGSALRDVPDRLTGKFKKPKKKTQQPTEETVLDEIAVAPVVFVPVQDEEIIPVKIDTPQDSEIVPINIAVPEDEEIVPVKIAGPEDEEVVPVKIAVPEDEEVVPVKIAAPEDEDVEPVKIAVPEDKEVVPVKIAVPKDEDVVPVKIQVETTQE